MTRISSISSIAFLLFNLNLTAQTPEFANTSSGFRTSLTNIAPSPEAALLADLDNNGDPDAVVAKGNFESGFTVLLNSGNGTYSTPVSYTTGFACWDITVADFNNDAIPDVVVSNRGTNYNGNSVSLFHGNGNGTFGAKTNFTVGTGPIGLTAADFNSDGFTDLAVANNGGFGSGSTVSILINNTTGGFNTAYVLTGIPKPYKLVSGFIDNDSLPDIVVANEEERITILHNTGTSFTATPYSMQAIQYNNLYSSVQLADIDNDNDPDILYSSLGTQHIAVRRNLGNGVLDSIQPVILDFFYGGTTSFQLHDFNSDGYPDIVAATSTGSTGDGYRISMNQGNGTFAPPTYGTAGQYTFAVLGGDVDGDGDTDVLTIDNYSNELTVHKNNGSGVFPTPVLFSTGFPVVTTKLEAADMDNDGDLDILTSADSRTAINVPVTVSKNNGNGTFAAAVTVSGSFGLGGLGAKFRDLNNDGFLDIVYASGINTSPYDFFTCLNNGNGTFAPAVRWNINSCGWNDLDAADMDNDGDIDVIITEWLGCPSEPFSARRIYICKNQGNATFAAPVLNVVNPFPGPIAICDFNEDGFLDVATGQSTSIDIALNDGAGNLLVPASFTMAQSPFDILATDLNNDGHADIASCNYGSNPGDYSLTVRLGNGNGTFQAVQLLDAAYSPNLANVSGIAAGDVDNDGDVDLIVSQNATHDMSMYLNNGSGVFAFEHRLCAYYGFRSPWFADFDGDGIKDLAAMVDMPPSGLQSALTILPGITTGTATGGAGLSACATIATQVVSQTNADNNSSISVFPNPFSNSAEVYFKTTSEGIYTITVYNAMGAEVQRVASVSKIGQHHFTLQRNNLPAGIYSIQINNGRELKSIKVVVSNN